MKSAKSFLNTFHWLETFTTCLSQSTISDDWKNVNTSFSSLSMKVKSGHDFYGNHFNMVPVLNMNISSLKESIESLAKTEQFFKDLRDAINEVLFLITISYYYFYYRYYLLYLLRKILYLMP